MINSKRVVALCLLLTVLLCGCGKDNNTKVVFTTGFAKDEVFKINNVRCTEAEIMVYLTNTQNQYENVYGSDIWQSSLDGVSLEENVKETVLAKIAQIKTMYMLAMERGVTLEDKEEENIKAAAKEYYDSLSDTEIKSMGVSYKTIEGLYREYLMAEKVYQLFISDVNPEISDDEARIVSVEQIFISKKLHPENAKAIAENVYDEVMTGAKDFKELAGQYSDDENIMYSYGKGELEEDMENVVFNLSTDQVGNIVENDQGYIIIKCINTLNRDETDEHKLLMVEERKNAAFGEEYDAYVDQLVRNLNQKLWDKISLIHDENVNTSSFFLIYDKYF